jgi:general nucleoside transport system permease protein
MKINEKKFDYIIKRLVSFIIAFIIAFVLTWILISISGYNIFQVFWLSLTGGFGSLQRLGLTLNETAPLLFCSLGYLVAFKSGVWNIGAEGQLFMGALGASVVGIYVKNLSAPLHIFLVIAAGFLFGALWGSIPGILKSRFNTNEIITSLLMNFIAIWFVSYLIRFPMADPAAYIPVSKKIAESARLPVLIPKTSSNWGVVLAFLSAIIIWYIFSKTVFGYRMKVLGTNYFAGLYGGISVKKLIVVTMFISGGLAGLAGMCQVAGVHFLLAEYISPAHYGFISIPIIFISRLNPFAAIIVCLFFGGLLTGGNFVQMKLGIDPTVITIFLSLIMISLMLDPFIEKVLNRLLYRRESSIDKEKTINGDI